MNDRATPSRDRRTSAPRPPSGLDRLGAAITSRVVGVALAELDAVVATSLADLGEVLGLRCAALFELRPDLGGLWRWQSWSVEANQAPGRERVHPSLDAIVHHVPEGISPRLGVRLRIGGATVGALVLDGGNDRPAQTPQLHDAHPCCAALAIALLRRDHARAQTQLRSGLTNDHTKPSEVATGQTELGPLTVRQLEVLRLLSRGQTMKEIAAALGVSPRTVAFHKYRIMAALKIRTNAELLMHALSCGLGER
ncbi:Response regulator [Enhygromyxa salina]|uniref:Response regulator n=1 Tax=Enhygromyxa salina TaxID=215803 RepID=A0A0C2DHZ6_9BACT|nr:LuxR C-terminal-related transcriptional regulator [Enhygromyxa salina]KIG19302.1 Response regulator [Enhygromyxa salina]